MLCPACNTGQRGACDCPAPAEASTHFGFEDEPAPSTRLQRLRAHTAAWLAALAILALYGLAEEPPQFVEPLGSAYLPGDGFPPELLAIIEPEPAASEAQP